MTYCSIPEDRWGVHETHCCKKHGCKYRDEDCPVELGLIEAIISCEQDTYNEGCSGMNDPYLNDDFAVERLYNEWKKYGKIFLACDFDDTIYDFHKKGFKYDRVIKLVKECQAQGCYTIIFTGSEVEKYPLIRQYCEEIGLKIDKINENAIPMNIGNNGKIYFNILLDDRSGLSSSYKILSRALTMMKADNH